MANPSIGRAWWPFSAYLPTHLVSLRWPQRALHLKLCKIGENSIKDCEGSAINRSLTFSFQFSFLMGRNKGKDNWDPASRGSKIEWASFWSTMLRRCPALSTRWSNRLVRNRLKRLRQCGNARSGNTSDENSVDTGYLHLWSSTNRNRILFWRVFGSCVIFGRSLALTYLVSLCLSSCGLNSV